jgi:hypothetical protein
MAIAFSLLDIGFLLQLILIGLKIGEVQSFSWLLVLAPLWALLPVLLLRALALIYSVLFRRPSSSLDAASPPAPR